jgi:uncharacterized protein with GYD domain
MLKYNRVDELLLESYDMPLFLQTSKHSTESCPMHNEKIKKIYSDFMSKMGQLTNKHGIKVVGAWASMPEHLIVVVYDVPNPEAMLKFSMEPEVTEWLSYQTTENRPVKTMEEVMKLLK